MDLAVATEADTVLTNWALQQVLHGCRPDGSNCKGMPSGHSSFAWALATAGDATMAHAVGAGLYAVAAYVSWSRVGGLKHYPSQVALGAVEGFVIGTAAKNALFHGKAAGIGHWISGTDVTKNGTKISHQFTGGVTRDGSFVGLNFRY